MIVKCASSIALTKHIILTIIVYLELQEVVVVCAICRLLDFLKYQARQLQALKIDDTIRVANSRRMNVPAPQWLASLTESMNSLSSSNKPLARQASLLSTGNHNTILSRQNIQNYYFHLFLYRS